MNTIFKYILICLLVVSPRLSAQIISIGDSVTINSEYSADDKLFFYKDITSAELTVAPVVGSDVKYTWERYENGSWTNAITNKSPEFPGEVTDGTAYRVTVKDDEDSESLYTCWTFVPEIISLKVDTIYSNCSNIQLTTNTTTKPLTYFDPAIPNPADRIPYTVNYQFEYAWSTEPPSATTVITDAQPVMDAPVEKTTYIVEVNAFNVASSLSANLVYDEPKAVKADFTFNVTDRENLNEITDSKFTDLTTFTGSSKVVVFINDSSKGLNKSYTIEFETTDGEEKPTETDLIEITFDKLGSYKMHITVTNSISGCTDLQTLGPIKIEEIYLDVPNVFTPDGDQFNNEFAAVYRSVKEFKMIVFNRWGRKVFQTTDPGEAWDGKIGGKDAAEGVYFYVVTAKGFNKGEEKKMEGPVHLFRGK